MYEQTLYENDIKLRNYFHTKFLEFKKYDIFAYTNFKNIHQINKYTKGKIKIDYVKVLCDPYQFGL